MLEPIKALISQPIITYAAAQSNHIKLTNKALKLADELWIKEVKTHQHDLAKNMLFTDASLYLKQWQRQFKGIITEIIVTDKQGKNVAISKITSDYWQGMRINLASYTSSL
ncbi:hypothetical protein P4S68_15140 [Pseudoalteromonas sp. Hal099]